MRVTLPWLLWGLEQRLNRNHPYLRTKNPPFFFPLKGKKKGGFLNSKLAMDEVEEGENSVVEHHGSRSEAVFLCVVCCVCCVHLWAHSPSVCIGDAASAEVSATPPGNGGR